MGLDLHIKGYETSSNSKIGSCSGFNDFREIWAKHLGFDLKEMIGFDGEKEWTNEPMQFFFNHSDCDGELSVEECVELLAQAEKDQPHLTDGQSEYSMPILIEYCKKAIEKNEPIRFI